MLRNGLGAESIVWTLMFGVMRLTNTAQGDFIVLGGFAAIAAASQFALHPSLAALLVLPLAFGTGYALQRWVLKEALIKREHGNALPEQLAALQLRRAVGAGAVYAYHAVKVQPPPGAVAAPTAGWMGIASLLKDQWDRRVTHRGQDHGPTVH